MEPADERLMALAGEGDAEAFRVLFRRHARPLFAYFVHTTGDRDMAEDLMQDTWLKVWAARTRYDGDRPFRPWLYRIAANTRADAEKSWWRTLARRSVSIFAPRSDDSTLADRLPAPDASGPDRLADAARTARLVNAALASLPPAHREALVLHELQGLSAKETAEAMGRPVATVLSWLTRGRAAMKARVAAAGGRAAWG